MKALEVLQQAAMLAPGEASIQIKLGAALLKYGDRNGGIAAFEKAAQLAPRDGDVQFQIGEIFKVEKNFEAASQAYQRALALKPTLMEANAALGEIQLAQEDYVGAIISYRRVIENIPDDAGAHFNMGLALKGRGGRETQAIGFFQKALELYQQQGNTEGVQKAQAVLREMQKKK